MSVSPHESPEPGNPRLGGSGPGSPQPGSGHPGPFAPGPSAPGPPQGMPGRNARRLPSTPVTYALIGACVVVWLLQLLTGDWIPRMFGFAAYWAAPEPYTALTTAFIHGGSMHIMFNMIGLYFFGTFLERYVGSGWFALLYLFSALGGSLAVFFLALADGSPQALVTVHIGASGALFGLVGFVATPTRRLDRNLTGVLGFVAINAVLIWLVPNISWQAHLGGFLTGFVFGCVYFFTPQRLRALGLLILTVVVAAVGFAALVLVPVTV
ncbi:rhomboid family intramembrane serine protease [Brevibacterium luteolum]|uniref:rhomboid family intramembrane serine protease n=1 Tax=Brevibacterium luteolum TaxID=199591 RepID=UPI00223B08E0|nr:rhomboid family intramembrane serine protease [Brevibacterium luteolum]MCT1922309.1 rhomboid family intramembrane serine protease [Brevibacterium luteolum]